MTADEFKSRLAHLVSGNHNQAAIRFATAFLPEVATELSGADRMLVADWMEGAETALDLGIDSPEGTLPAQQAS